MGSSTSSFLFCCSYFCFTVFLRLLGLYLCCWKFEPLMKLNQLYFIYSCLFFLYIYLCIFFHFFLSFCELGKSHYTLLQHSTAFPHLQASFRTLTSLSDAIIYQYRASCSSLLTSCSTSKNSWKLRQNCLLSLFFIFHHFTISLSLGIQIKETKNHSNIILSSL